MSQKYYYSPPMPDFSFKMKLNQFRLGLRPRPGRGAYSGPQTPYLDLGKEKGWNLEVKERGDVKERVGERRGQREGRRKGPGRGRKDRGKGKGKFFGRPLFFPVCTPVNQFTTPLNVDDHQSDLNTSHTVRRTFVTGHIHFIRFIVGYH